MRKGESMKTFKQFLAESEEMDEAISKIIRLFEHETYKPIPGTKNSYRMDSGNTNKHTIKHSHIYANPKGGGAELYSVNYDGSGHDGSSGREIPTSHADYFRSLGYTINKNNILECLELGEIDESIYTLILLENA
jgi:hypothetical protein